jgi:hypothetical protein
MAVVKNPFLSTDARGSLSGMTATVVKGGLALKRKMKPARRPRSPVANVRTLLGYLARQWGELTDAQRSQWEQWALDHPQTDKFGDPFIMSGMNAYVQLNHTAVRLGLIAAYSATPPEDPPASSLETLTVVQGATNPGDIDLDWTHLGTGDASDYVECQIAGPFQSEGKVSVQSRFTYVTKVAGDLTSHTLAALVEGFWYWVRCRYVAADGQTTAFLMGQATPKLTV